MKKHSKKSPPPLDLTPEIEAKPDPIDLTAEQTDKVVVDAKLERLKGRFLGARFSFDVKKWLKLKQ
jgi:hypothetical protein